MSLLCLASRPGNGVKIGNHLVIVKELRKGSAVLTIKEQQQEAQATVVPKQTLQISPGIELFIHGIRGGKCYFAIDAPQKIPISRYYDQSPPVI